MQYTLQPSQTVSWLILTKLNNRTTTKNNTKNLNNRASKANEAEAWLWRPQPIPQLSRAVELKQLEIEQSTQEDHSQDQIQFSNCSSDRLSIEYTMAPLPGSCFRKCNNSKSITICQTFPQFQDFSRFSRYEGSPC